MRSLPPKILKNLGDNREEARDLLLDTSTQRDNRAYLIIGGPGTGKSTWAKVAAEACLDVFTPAYARQGIKPRSLIHDYNNGRCFSAIKSFQAVVNHLIKNKVVKMATAEEIKALEKSGELEEMRKRWLTINPRKPVLITHRLDLLRLRSAKKKKPFWSEGQLRFVSNEDKEIQMFYNYVKNFYRNGCLVLDEGTNYMEGKLTTWQKYPFFNRRHLGLEIFVIFHQIKTVPPKLVISDLFYAIILFDTKERLQEKHMERYANSVDMIAAYKQVARQKKEEGVWIQDHKIVVV